MTDQSLRRADDLLTELVELVETARSMPMSSSCVVPREQVLDLLDDLREVLPPEIGEARKIIAARDGLLHDAYTAATQAREAARTEAESVVAGAQQRAGQLVRDAEAQADEIVERGRAEHADLVSATRVHQEATEAAAKLREDATSHDRQVRGAAAEYSELTRSQADRFAFERRTDAEAYAQRLVVDSDDYADRTLAEMAAVLQQACGTAEQGRLAIAARRARHTPAAAEADRNADRNPAPVPA